MNRKDSPQSVIDSYRRRQQMAPYFMAGLAILLVVVGIIILVVWFTGSKTSKGNSLSLFASPTATVTETVTPTPVTPTVTPTNTPTETSTPTITLTATPSGPFEYTVKEGDNCWDIAANFNVDLDVLLVLNNFGNTCPIKKDDKILIPLPDTKLPTSTAVPTTASGQKIKYRVESGDTLDTIASKFGTTVDKIVTENNITDINLIKIGDELTITVYTVTQTPTRAPTITITPGGPTLTPENTATNTP